MSVPPASVIVVSRGRPDALVLCLAGLAQQDHPAFEVVVVADPAGLAAARAMGLRLKLVEFELPNISAARNAGLSVAAGEGVAFIDDDAVAEPTWLRRLMAGLAQAPAATGFVRGRNGISWQWRAAEVDGLGQDYPLEAAGVVAPAPGRAVKTVGTNCAFRARDLRQAGGFDPAFRFYLDEADLNLRMGGPVFVEPGAVVHHAFAASERRRADRVPLRLDAVGASSAIFLGRHAPGADMAAAFARLQAEQAARMAAHVTARRIGQAEADEVLASLRAGWQAGLSADAPRPAPLPGPEATFLPLPGTGPRPGRVIAGRIWQKRRLLAQAEAAVAAGEVVTLLILSPTMRAHRHGFQPGGFWLQEGGLFGRSDRAGPRFRWWTFRRRVAAESGRIASFRPTGPASRS